jgi:membrane protein implicated in regulation of membrane protease activity
MEFQIWHYWFIVAFFFLVLEVFVPGFILGSIGIGCLLGGLGAILHLPLWFNILLFISGFFIGISMLKPLLKRLEKPSKVKTNAEGLIGRTGLVTEIIDRVSGTGRVRIDGDEWKAIPQNGGKIEKGTEVEVFALESIVVTVRPINTVGEKADQKPKAAQTLKENKGLIISIGNRKELVYHSDIVCFYSNQKITYLVNSESKQLIVDESLEKLEEQLDNNLFFRANRQFIISAQLIKEYRPDASGNISVTLKPTQNLPESISVSRLKAHAFRKWIGKQV